MFVKEGVGIIVIQFPYNINCKMICYLMRKLSSCTVC